MLVVNRTMCMRGVCLCPKGVNSGEEQDSPTLGPTDQRGGASLVPDIWKADRDGHNGGRTALFPPDPFLAGRTLALGDTCCVTCLPC